MTISSNPAPSLTAIGSDRGRQIPKLVPNGAFVLQLAAAEGVPPAIGGRIEHIPTGEWRYFDGVDELIGFLSTMAGRVSR